MRGLSADEYALLLEEDGTPLCNCGPNGEPGEVVSSKGVSERLVKQGRAAWVECSCGAEHFVVTEAGREAMRIHRAMRVQCQI